MTQTELEKTHELVPIGMYRVYAFYQDTDGPSAHVCSGCPGQHMDSCYHLGCSPGTVWVPKEHAAIIKIAYRKEP